MTLILVGTNHKYSPIELRERISFSKKRINDALNFLKQNRVLKGAVILSTCNRLEIYASTIYPDQAEEEIISFLSRYQEIGKDRISPYLYIYKGKEAARHLFQVTSGLDSQILGEAQILGQVKSLYEEACRAGFTDKILTRIFNSAISFARKIHRSTKVREGKVSIGSVAIDFIKRKVGTLANKNILIIGVGKVTELVLKYLKKEEPNVIFVSNRTFEKAQELAGQIGARAVRFDQLKDYLPQADVVITATASPHFVLKKETVRQTIDYKPLTINHKLLILDLALPRDVEPQVRKIEGVELFCLEDLDAVIKENLERKKREAEKVKKIIDIEVEKLWNDVTKLEPEPALLL